MKPSITGVRLENPAVSGTIATLGALVTGVTLALGKFDVAESLVRGGGPTDAVTCKPSEGNHPLEGWVLEWKGNQPTAGSSYTATLWQAGSVVVTRSGTSDSLGSDRIVDLTTTTVTYPALVLGANNVPSIQVTTYTKDTDFEFDFMGDHVSPKVNWKTTSPPLTEPLSFTWTLGEVTVTYLRDTDWKVENNAFVWLVAEASRPTAEGTLAVLATRPFTYPVAYVKEATTSAVRGAGNTDSLGAYPGLVRLVTVDGAKDGKSWSFLPDQDFGFHATLVRPLGLAPGSAYTFTGKTTKTLAPNTDFTLGTALVDGVTVSTLELTEPPSPGSNLFVECSVALRDAY